MCPNRAADPRTCVKKHTARVEPREISRGRHYHELNNASAEEDWWVKLTKKPLSSLFSCTWTRFLFSTRSIPFVSLNFILSKMSFQTQQKSRSCRTVWYFHMWYDAAPPCDCGQKTPSVARVRPNANNRRFVHKSWLFLIIECLLKAGDKTKR